MSRFLVQYRIRCIDPVLALKIEKIEPTTLFLVDNTAKVSVTWHKDNASDTGQLLQFGLWFTFDISSWHSGPFPPPAALATLTQGTTSPCEVTFNDVYHELYTLSILWNDLNDGTPQHGQAILQAAYDNPVILVSQTPESSNSPTQTANTPSITPTTSPADTTTSTPTPAGTSLTRASSETGTNTTNRDGSNPQETVSQPPSQSGSHTQISMENGSTGAPVGGVINLPGSSTFASNIERSSGLPNTPTSSSDPTNNAQSSQNGGRIAGAVVGAAVGVILVVVLIIILRRRRRRKEIHQSKEEPVISPYPDTTSASNVAGEKKRALLDQESRLLKADSVPVHEEASSHDAAPNQRTGEVTENENENHPGPVERTRRVMYHDDSGWRPSAHRSDAGESSVLEMPPRYDSAI
ncbi:hypothetical protein VNI00_016690 [Paramarasmius palmivorus]|uniref:Uncharacterized protein n=1 Tax=Paramarasmius palmivorus TaxID=297713 RepID=A0AAW0BEW0_9AGAR